MPIPGKSFAPACRTVTVARPCRMREKLSRWSIKQVVPALRAAHANTAHELPTASYALEVRMDPSWTQSNGHSSGSGRRKLQNIAEVLANLTYLTLKEADRP